MSGQTTSSDASDPAGPSREASDPRGWILYDGECGICRSWVPRWERLLKGRGFDIAPLQEEWVAERLEGKLDDLLSDIQLLLADGRLLSGPEAYRFVLRDIWWTRPLYWLTRLPLASRFFDACYRRFADNRHEISRSCGLDSRRTP